jgi:hypothetical protein
VGTGRCLPNLRVARQPLGFDSLALRAVTRKHLSSLDKAGWRAILKMFGKRRLVRLSPELALGAFTFQAPARICGKKSTHKPYVPSLHPARYSSCSGVRRSILIPMDSSFSRATRLSSSSGTL